ncbi:response regulator [candidate division KSB1 bacterium]|nr:response regulator [candidate division KSB1 bacterium]
MILVVNDDPDMLALTLSQLREAGYTDLRAASDGDEALLSARTERPDLIVSDVSMPRVDGFQLCRILHAPLFAGSDAIPVILTSATYRDVIAEEIARNVHAFAYLQEPHVPGTLIRLIEIACGRATAQPDDTALLRYLGQILIIDDDPDMIALLESLLTSDGWNVTSAATSEQGLQCLSRPGIQLVLLDYHIPDGDGLTLLKRIKSEQPGTVVIMMTADTDEQKVIDLITNGADDYLRKPFELASVSEACKSALNKYNFLRIHEQFQEKMQHLRSVSEYLDLVINLSQEAIFSCDLDGHVKIWNKGAERMYGYAAAEITGQVVDDFLDPPDFKRKSPDLIKILLQRGGSMVEPEVIRRKKNGDDVHVYSTYSVIHNAQGEYIGFSVIERDVTPVLALEAERIKSARLRAITQTAVTANDQINTPLGVILGYAQFLQRKTAALSPDDEQALAVIQQQVLKIKAIMNKLKLMSDPIVKNYSIEGVTMFDLSKSL